MHRTLVIAAVTKSITTSKDLPLKDHPSICPREYTVAVATTAMCKEEEGWKFRDAYHSLTVIIL